MLQLIKPVHKQVILMKLTDLMERAPSFDGTDMIHAGSPQRLWLSQVGAVLKKLDSVSYGMKFDSNLGHIGNFRVWAVNEIKGQVTDAIETLKLDLELEGRNEIGNVYETGAVYELFSDLKDIIGGASNEILLVDPYFTGAAFDDYLSMIQPERTIRILTDRYAKDVWTYGEMHRKQYGSDIEIRQSGELHDRLVIVDGSDCWVVGGSIKDAAAKSPTYLLPLQPELAQSKCEIYSKIWNEASSLK